MRKVVPVGEDPNTPTPTCRNANAPYEAGQAVYTVDGFLLSANVNYTYAYALNEQFAFSDHNPIVLSFSLQA